MSNTLPYDPKTAIKELSRADRKLGQAIRRLGAFELELSPVGDPFEYLARAIVFQQLSGKAAATIHGRVEALFPRKRIRPQPLLDLPDEALRGAGLSRNKLAALRDLARHRLDRTVPTLKQLEKMADDEIIERLVQVRGIGRWTVEMLLLFRLGRPDIMPATDLGIQKGFAILHESPDLPKPKQLLEETLHWQPWRSVASWYLYRLTDQNP